MTPRNDLRVDRIRFDQIFHPVSFITPEADAGAPPRRGMDSVARNGILIGGATSGGMVRRANRMLAVASVESKGIASGIVLKAHILRETCSVVAVEDPVFDPKLRSCCDE